MNKRQQKILSRIDEKPTRSDITWSEVHSLFKALGAEISRGEGSRVQIILKAKILRLHKPHPNKEMRKYAVEAIRDFLTNLEVNQ
jgi:hypothetical protein